VSSRPPSDFGSNHRLWNLYSRLLLKHAVLRSKSKSWLVRNQDNVHECSNMYTRKLLFQWGSTIKIQLSSNIGRVKPKTIKFGICCLSAKHTVLHAGLRRKSKYWLARCPDNVCKWNELLTPGLLFQWACNLKTELSVLGLTSTRQTTPSFHLNIACFPHDIGEKRKSPLNGNPQSFTHCVLYTCGLYSLVSGTMGL
jgi:hypothetical protein